MLGPGLRWDHRVGAHGASVQISFSEDRVISSGTVRGVLNRLREIPSWRSLRRLRAADRDYASQELAAFFLSWLSCLPQPVLNRPTPQGLAGRERHIAEWISLATVAGLPTAPYWQSSRTYPTTATEGISRSEVPPLDTVLVIDRYIFGAAPSTLLSACRRLATLATTPILGIAFTGGATGSWTFAGATPLPDLRAGGEPALDALAEVLQAERGSQ